MQSMLIEYQKTTTISQIHDLRVKNVRQLNQIDFIIDSIIMKHRICEF
jgi:hypothetical protein